MRQIRIQEHEGYYFDYDPNDPSVPVTIHSNWRKTGKTPAVIDLTYSRPLKSADDRDRLYVTIATMGKKERLYLDTLVAKYVLDNPNNFTRVIHKDDNIYNCHPSNLKWVSEDEYRDFAVRINRSKHKEFEAVYKDGRKEIVTGFLKFLEENNLTEHTLYRLRKGEISEYNGLVSFSEIKQAPKRKIKDPLEFNLSGYDTAELKDWPGYYVVYKKDDPSEKVRIFSKWKKIKDDMILSEEFVRETSQHIHKTGYYQVNMKLPGSKKIVQKVHRLVAQQLVDNPNPEKLDSVDHIDWDKSNNHPSNLQWMTLSENSIKGGNPELSTKEKWYEVTYSDGRKERLKNLSKFCRENDYSRSTLDCLLKEKQAQHKDIVKITKLEES